MIKNITNKEFVAIIGANNICDCFKNDREAISTFCRYDWFLRGMHDGQGSPHVIANRILSNADLIHTEFTKSKEDCNILCKSKGAKSYIFHDSPMQYNLNFKDVI